MQNSKYFKISLFFILSLLVSGAHLLAQTFSGQLHYLDGHYKATLRINADSSIVMVCRNDSNSYYEECYGNIQHKGDDLFTLNIKDGFHKQIWPSIEPQYGLVDHVMYVDADTALRPMLFPVVIQYPTGYKVNYDLNKRYTIAIPNPPRYPYHYKIYTSKKDTLSGKPIVFTGYSNYYTLFRKRAPDKLSLRIAQGKLNTIKPSSMPERYDYNLQLKSQPSKK